jgi:hypothetical protein
VGRLFNKAACTYFFLIVFIDMSRDFVYVEPDVALSNDAGFPAEVLKKKDLPLPVTILSTVNHYFSSIKTNEIVENTHYDKYRFSVNRDIFNIEPYSFIHPPSMANFLNVLCENIGRVYDVEDSKLSVLMGTPSYMFFMPKQPGNLFMRLNIIDQRSRRDRPERQEKPDEYKIHLCVKEEYQLYAFLKLALIFLPAFLRVEPDLYLELKWNTISRFSHLLPDDSTFRNNNGGPAATVVLYTRTSDPNIMRTYLKTILTAFPEHNIIGSMDLENKDSIPYGNVRLNRLLCYAQGDRNQKLKAKNANLKAAVPYKKPIPDWIKELNESQSRLYLGLAALKNRGINDNCVEDICYLAIDKTMLDPRTIVAGGRRKRKTRKYTSKKKIESDLKRLLFFGEMNVIRQKKVPKLYSVSLEKKRSYVLPAGNYFIGDPIYFLHTSILGSEPGHYALPDGRGFILIRAETGIWRSSDGNHYGVESGLLGICSYEIGNATNFTGDGTFHTFKSEVTSTILEGGVLRISSGDFVLDVNDENTNYKSDFEGYDSCG